MLLNKKKLLTCFFLVCVSLSALSQVRDKKVKKELKNHIEFLASDSLLGRETGTLGEELARQYIAQQFSKINLSSFYPNYSQKFEIKTLHHHVKLDEPIISHNVVGYIDNLSEKTIIIGAHYDHLGMGEEGSLHVGQKAIHNGADDNASGVALLIELADYFSRRKINSNLIFVAFSGEEKGLLGSNYFANNFPIELSAANFMINMDMVGRYDNQKGVVIGGVGTSPFWSNALEKISVNGLKTILDSSGVGPSDHTSFYLKDIPVLHFFTGAHEDYHKPTDDAEKINYQGMVIVMNTIIQIINQTATIPKLNFTKTKEKQNNTPKFSVTLGVIPDYLFDGQGMRIEGVLEGKTAKSAGIISGDIVVKLGEIKVIDMMTYMEGLSKFSKGDKTQVTIKRGEQIIYFDIEF